MNEKESMSIGELDFDFNEYEKKLEEDIEKDLADLQMLKEDKEKIANPDALGDVVLREIWNQFGNQIGLDMSKETLIQRYNRKHPETYDIVGKKVMQDKRYIEVNKEMKTHQAEGNLRDEYTGKTLNLNDKANLDHTVSRNEIFKNERRRQAGIATEDLANKKENLNATNESLNLSKGAKSIDKLIETREQRDTDLRAQNERANKKIDESNMSETEKRLKKEKNNKRLHDKLDADDVLMKEKDRQVRKAINKDIAKGVAKETGKKAGKDALKTMAVQALFDLLKEIINALIRFFKQTAKSFRSFLDEMKTAFKKFSEKLTSWLKSGAMTAVGTIVSEIFGPVRSVFQKLASLIKQGFRSLGDAIAYLKDKKNRNKSFSIKVAEVGKIIVAGLVAMGAIFSGEVFEKALIAVFPALGTIQFPLLGSLANMIGLFLASIISGVIGAIVLNVIDKVIERKQKADNVYAQFEKGNDILEKQSELIKVKTDKLFRTEERVATSIKENHEVAKKIIGNAVNEMTFMHEHSEITKDEIDRLLLTLQEN